MAAAATGPRTLAAELGARVVTAPRGRGAQLAAGVAAARGEWLLLLHADTRLEAGWRRAMVAPDFAGYFRFALDSDDRRARRLERLVAWRCRLLALPYGDQGLLIHRDLLADGGRDPGTAADGGRRPGPPPRASAAGGAGHRRGHLGGEMAAGRLVPPLAAQPRLPGAVFRRRAAAADRAALRMRDTVVVFARAPRLGAVKRRLAREIGDRAALRFHVTTLTRLLRALASDRRFRTVLAVTPDHARFRLPVRVDRIPQGQRRSRRADASRVPALSPLPGGHHRLRYSGCRTAGCVVGLSRTRLRAGSVRAGGGWRLLAGGDVASPSGAAVRRRALVHRTCASRHAGEFFRAACHHAAHAARCGYRGGPAPFADAEEDHP